jgi:hypothetical protein
MKSAPPHTLLIEARYLLTEEIGRLTERVKGIDIALEIIGDKPIATEKIKRRGRPPKEPQQKLKGWKPAKEKQPRTTVNADGEKVPRVTIRQRILDALGTGEKLESEIVLIPKRQGVNTDHALTHQQLYLMKRDGKIVRDEDTEMYRLREG